MMLVFSRGNIQETCHVKSVIIVGVVRSRKVILDCDNYKMFVVTEM